MAIIDIPGFVADIKEHATDHQFHIHDERHFVETYSMRQAWEVDLHPEHACGGPLDLHLSIDLDPRVALSFEDQMMTMPEDAEPNTGLTIPLMFTWSLPPLTKAPDLLVLATDLAGVGGADLPLKVAAIDSTAEVPTPQSDPCRSPQSSISASTISSYNASRCATSSTVASKSVNSSSTEPRSGSATSSRPATCPPPNRPTGRPDRSMS